MTHDVLLTQCCLTLEKHVQHYGLPYKDTDIAAMYASSHTHCTCIVHCTMCIIIIQTIESKLAMFDEVQKKPFHIWENVGWLYLVSVLIV